MRRTNIELDEKLVNSALKITGLKTKKALIHFALKELIRHSKQKKLLALKGKIHWEGNLDSSRKDTV